MHFFAKKKHNILKCLTQSNNERMSAKRGEQKMDVLEKDWAWLFVRLKREIQARMEKARKTRNNYFNKDMDIYYYWSGYVSALYEIQEIMIRLEKKITTTEEGE